MEDDKLIEMVKNGDKEAFGVLYDRYVSSIYRYFFIRLGGEKNLAEDLTHEVFLSAWRNILNYETKGASFLSYLFKIARNELTDHWRKKKLMVSMEDVPELALGTSNPDFVGKMEEARQIELLKKAMSLLEGSYQEVLILKFVEELSNKEIAEILGKSEGAVRVLQHRALKQLRSILSKYENEY